MITVDCVFTGDQYCSNNIASAITSLIDAIWADVLTVTKLLAVCFGKVIAALTTPCPVAFAAFRFGLARRAWTALNDNEMNLQPY